MFGMSFMSDSRRSTPGPPVDAKLRQLKQRFDFVTDPAAPLTQRVLELHKLAGASSFGEHGKELWEMGAIPVLVQMATEGFPEDGDLASSNSPWDGVAKCSPTTPQPEARGHGIPWLTLQLPVSWKAGQCRRMVAAA